MLHMQSIGYVAEYSNYYDTHIMTDLIHIMTDLIHFSIKKKKKQEVKPTYWTAICRDNGSLEVFNSDKRIIRQYFSFLHEKPIIYS